MTRLLNNIGGWIERVDLAGWMLLISGCGLLAITMIVPVRAEMQEFAWKRDKLAVVAQMLEEQRENHESFVNAVQSNDPQLLQRLAMHFHYLTPTGAETIDSTDELADAFAIDQWLAAGHVSPPESPQLPDTLLITLGTGSNRPWVMALSVWLILFSMLTKTDTRRSA